MRLNPLTSTLACAASQTGARWTNYEVSQRIDHRQ